MLVEKLCPVVTRGRGADAEILVFQHPLAGTQLVKGTREPGEPVVDGALRELAEESGLFGQQADGTVWSSRAIVDGQLWHFVPVRVVAAPNLFSFLTPDDGGRVFDFFWWSLARDGDDCWHPMFKRALNEIRANRS